jgi:hypothetical protein
MKAILADGHRCSSGRWLKKMPPHYRSWWPRHPYWCHGSHTPHPPVVAIPSWFGGCVPPRWPPSRASRWPGSGAALVHCCRTCVLWNGRLDRAQVSMQLMNVFHWNVTLLICLRCWHTCTTSSSSSLYIPEICPCCSNIVQMIKEISSICLFFMVVQCCHVGISVCRMNEHRMYLELMVHNQFIFLWTADASTRNHLLELASRSW